MKAKQVLLVAFTVLGMTGCSNNFNRYNYDSPATPRAGDLRTDSERDRRQESKPEKKEPPIQPKLIGVCPAFVPPKLPAPPAPPKAALERARALAAKETAELEAKNISDPKVYAAERDKINRIFDAIEKDYIIALSRHAYNVQRISEQANAKYREECDKWVKAQKFVKDNNED